MAELAARAIEPWKDDGKGRITLNTGGQLMAEKTAAAFGKHVIYIPNGEKFTVGYKNAAGTFVAVTSEYTAVASTGKSFCKVRIRLRPDVLPDDAGKVAPPATPAKSEAYLRGHAWLVDKAKFTPAVKIGADVLELSDQATAVAVGAGKMCKLEMRVKLLASRPVPPEPEVIDEGVSDPYIPPPKYSVPPDDDPPPE